jgi:hypothetical protein
VTPVAVAVRRVVRSMIARKNITLIGFWLLSILKRDSLNGNVESCANPALLLASDRE